MKILTLILAAMLDIVPGGQAYMKQLQPRDSILIADQIEYGFTLDGVKDGTMIALPDWSSASNDTLTLVRNWQIDTLKVSGSRKKPASRLFNLRASVVLAPFEEGHYELPAIFAQRTSGAVVDTLAFEPLTMDVTTIQVDTATFQIHDIKPQMRYPVTFREIAPWLLGALLLALAAFLIARMVARRRQARMNAAASADPAHIVALRELEKYRSDKYWAPEKQKAFYSGITDTLKVYIDGRFGIDAPEMTTAELFTALKGRKELTPELYNELREMFERADFVKFAKYVASEDENVKALPLAVRFVTATYQSEIEEEHVL